MPVQSNFVLNLLREACKNPKTKEKYRNLREKLSDPGDLSRIFDDFNPNDLCPENALKIKAREFREILGGSFEKQDLKRRCHNLREWTCVIIEGGDSGLLDENGFFRKKIAELLEWDVPQDSVTGLALLGAWVAAICHQIVRLALEPDLKKADTTEHDALIRRSVLASSFINKQRKKWVALKVAFRKQCATKIQYEECLRQYKECAKQCEEGFEPRAPETEKMFDETNFTNNQRMAWAALEMAFRKLCAAKIQYEECSKQYREYAKQCEEDFELGVEETKKMFDELMLPASGAQSSSGINASHVGAGIGLAAAGAALAFALFGSSNRAAARDAEEKNAKDQTDEKDRKNIKKDQAVEMKTMSPGKGAPS